MRKAFLLFLGLYSFSLAPCIAQQLPLADQPATAADVERYFDAAHVRDNMQQMIVLMNTQVRQMIHNQLLATPDLPADAEEKMNKRYDLLTKNMADLQAEMLKVTEGIYEKHFTKGDMDALVAFYSSPVGQKLVMEQPALAAESLQASSDILKKFMDQTRQELNDDILEMQQARKDSPPSAEAPSH